MLPGFAVEFAREDALVPRRDCAHLAAKPYVSQSLPLVFFFGGNGAQSSLRIFRLALTGEAIGHGSTKPSDRN